MKGWVYVISNRGKPGIVKVGYSSKDPELRARGLDSTADPYPHLVDYEALINDPKRLEQKTHAALKSKRISDEGVGTEWFKASSEEAVAAIRQIAIDQIITEDFKRTKRDKIEALQNKEQLINEKKAKVTANRQMIAEKANEEKRKMAYLHDTVEKLSHLPENIFRTALSEDRLPGDYDAWTLITRAFGEDKPTEAVRKKFMNNNMTRTLVKSHQGYLVAKSFQSKDWQRAIDAEFEKSSRQLRKKLQNQLNKTINSFYDG